METITAAVNGYGQAVFPCGCVLTPGDDDNERPVIAMLPCQLHAAAPALLAACREAHNATDLLFARLIEADRSFFPSKSGQPWWAMLKVTAAIAEATGVGA